MTKTDIVRYRTQRSESVTLFSGLKKNYDNPPSAKAAVLFTFLPPLSLSIQQETEPITNPTHDGLFIYFLYKIVIPWVHTIHGRRNFKDTNP